MTVRSNIRWTAIVLLTVPLLSAGCIRRTAVSQDFGLTGRAPSRLSSFRQIIQQQSGVFNPLNDVARVQELQDRLKVNGQDVAARLELAAIYESFRLYDDAIEQYKASLQGPIAEQAANVWNQLGVLYDVTGNLASGEHAFREAVKLNQSDRLHNNLGYNLLLQKKTDEAESEFRKALESGAASATTHNNLGVVLARRGDLQGALEQFQFGADEAAAHNNLAVALLEAGQYEQSREELVKALAIKRNFAPALANFKLVQEKIRNGTEGANSK